MSARPTEISLRGDVLVIQWNDGRRKLYDIADLRRNCPCAACRGHGSIIGEERRVGEMPIPPVSITQMTPVGNYAYRIGFSDGHDTGLYTLDLLNQLGRDE